MSDSREDGPEVQVSHSEYEFTLDFVRLDFTQQPSGGIVVARVAVSPLFITQLIDALQGELGEVC